MVKPRASFRAGHEVIWIDDWVGRSARASLTIQAEVFDEFLELTKRGLPSGDLEFGIARSSRRYYLWPMTTMTLKLPETLRRGVEEEARRRGVAKSVLVRECVEAMLRRKQRRKPTTCLDLVGDLVGSQPGPRDASVNRRHLEEAVLTDHGRARKNSH